MEQTSGIYPGIQLSRGDLDRDEPRPKANNNNNIESGMLVTCRMQYAMSVSTVL